MTSTDEITDETITRPPRKRPASRKSPAKAENEMQAKPVETLDRGPERHAPEPTETSETPKRKPGRPKGSKNRGPARSPRADAKPRPVGRPPKPQLKKVITGQVEQVGGLIVLAGAALQRPALIVDGQIIAMRSEAVGAEIAAIAERNPAVKRALLRMTETAGIAQTIAVVASVALPIAANHGLVPVDLVGPFVPDGIELHRPEVEPKPKSEGPVQG